MRFLHLSDLHIGKKLGDYPLYEDQRFVLNQAIELVAKENLDAVVIAGDVYDSSAPSAEAMEFYDEFLTSLFRLHKPILMISGNHDSPERLSVASKILRENGVHIVSKVSDSISPITIEGVDFFLLPYFRISDVNRAFDAEARSFSEAAQILLSKMAVDPSKPSVLVAHQAFLPIGEKVPSSGSETSLGVDGEGYVGGSEVIDVSLLSFFDYVALGHIHKAQNVAKNARYAGALLKYHIDEANANRSFTIVDIKQKQVEIIERPISFLRDLVVLQGDLASILSSSGHEGDYVAVKLTDAQYVDNPMGQLKAKYPYCIGMSFSSSSSEMGEKVEFDNVEEMDKNDLFAAFYAQYGQRELDEQEKELAKKIFDKTEEDA